jgi:putative endonuclease
MKQYFIYILKNTSGLLYIGITSDLKKRLYEHKEKLVEGFTQKYNIDKLVYYEMYSDAMTAIEREKQLKKWSRSKKLLLIKKMNPGFVELNIEL